MGVNSEAWEVTLPTALYKYIAKARKKSHSGICSSFSPSTLFDGSLCILLSCGTLSDSCQKISVVCGFIPFNNGHSIFVLRSVLFGSFSDRFCPPAAASVFYCFVSFRTGSIDFLLLEDCKDDCFARIWSYFLLIAAKICAFVLEDIAY